MFNLSNIPLVIFAGGLGTRMRGVKDKLPKPMIKICGIPIIARIINHYAKFGVKNFIICGGYKVKIIKDYFKKNKFNDLDINVVNTGKFTMTGGRLKIIRNYIKSNNFFLTYGDGISNVSIKKLYKFHLKNKKIATCLAVYPPARYGALTINKNTVTSFVEKPNFKNKNEGWINGGFFVLKNSIFKYLKDENTIFERKPLEKLSKIKQLGAMKYKGFWRCMDTPKDKEEIEKYLRTKI